MLKLLLFSSCWILLSLPHLHSQQISGTVQGQVIDAASENPLPYATVRILLSDREIGTKTDESGEFRLEGIPVGRQKISVEFEGYTPYQNEEILVTSGNAVVLTIRLKEMAYSMKEVVIRPKNERSSATNPLATVNAHQLNMEQANRYAGGFDDPARLVSSFAGVASSLSTNELIIHGNSPKGILWRMEGVAIPNPNHFADINGFGGGGITALSSKMLGNSDFMTGAFPAEYGNALSGVFDLSVRTGNSAAYQHSIKAGLLGLDLASEGPFKKGGKASYLFNYRYSTFGLIDVFLPTDLFGITYQDFSFKLNFPTQSAGTFSLWGLGLKDQAKSSPDADTVEADAKWQYYDDISSENSFMETGIVGLNHKVLIGTKGYLKTTVSASVNRISSENGRLDSSLLVTNKLDDILFSDIAFQLSSVLNTKLSASHTNRTGIIATNLGYNFDLREAPFPGAELTQFALDSGQSMRYQAFTQSSISLGRRLVLNPGLHVIYFQLNEQFSLEPRFSGTFSLNESSKISFGYGLHSQMEKLSFYLSDIPSGTTTAQLNRDLGFSKAHHFVLGYHQSLGRYTHLKIEPFYQALFDIPVVPGSPFSLINQTNDFFINDELRNEGTGQNLGIDVTVERYLNNGWYYLASASIFDSKFTTAEGVEYDTKFNRQLVGNLLLGKEWTVKEQNLLNVSLKYTYLGGDRDFPVNEAASLAAKDIILDTSNSYSVRNPQSNILSMTLTYRINKENISSHWSLQVLNVLGAQEALGSQYNFRNHTIDPNTDVIVVPNLSYEIHF